MILDEIVHSYAQTLTGLESTVLFCMTVNFVYLPPFTSSLHLNAFFSFAWLFMYCFIEIELSLIVKKKSQAGSQLDRVYSSYLKSAFRSLLTSTW